MVLGDEMVLAMNWAFLNISGSVGLERLALGERHFEIGSLHDSLSVAIGRLGSELNSENIRKI